MDNEFERQDNLQQPELLDQEGYVPEQSESTEESCNPQQPEENVKPMPHFEPSSEYRWVRPDPVSQPVKASKREKKTWSTGKVVALALCCSLLGGAFGAGIMNLMIGTDGTDGTAVGNQNVSNVLVSQRETSKININEIKTGELMSAAEVYAANVNSTVGITTMVTTNFWGYQTTSPASGSGFVYSDDGYILTNFHVIEDSSSITVSMYDGRELAAKLIGYDESNDIAVLKVEAENLIPVIIGDSGSLNVGDPVVAIGNPLGELTFSLTAGAVSALEREVTFSGGITMNLIQTDCAINSGNSGGALFNMYGEVIGITNAKYSGNSNSGASIDNIGFAIPMNRVRSIVDSIIEKGYVVKPYIGVSVVDVSAETQSYGLPQGAAVRSVEEGGPAQTGGLQPNDIITRVNDREITGSVDLKSMVTESKPGDVLHMVLWRKGSTIELDITVGEQIQSGTTQQPEQNQSQQSGGISGFPFFDWGY